jgi:hypothetical protein
VGTRARLVVAVSFGTVVFALLAIGLPTDGLLYGLVVGAVAGSLAFVRLAPKRPVLEVRIVRDDRRHRSTEFKPRFSRAWGRPRKRGR